ncbi:hypothetical protein, conserved [Eimeria tenella]|uniref:Uncharacterized protein n=1 Tax=Eimeria tenella TaxID=5802 RepID=U6KSX4_EIMTE|nr:hypothetical protein, conserved [Eimeria tenella]CDJ38528.1 hypothetical protein, conserved [Eimeria tenella]|eukprot:XP_013229366.1 hypothetical protein, conserved [Eimeria tenella]
MGGPPLRLLLLSFSILYFSLGSAAAADNAAAAAAADPAARPASAAEATDGVPAGAAAADEAAAAADEAVGAEDEAAAAAPDAAAAAAAAPPSSAAAAVPPAPAAAAAAPPAPAAAAAPPLPAAAEAADSPLAAAAAAAAAGRPLSEEELEAAAAEIEEELRGLQRLGFTKTTTPAPGFFKEFGMGLKNFALAPFRAAAEVFRSPLRAAKGNKGSMLLLAHKVGDAAADAKKRWTELARDVWRLATMSPERMQQAKQLQQTAAIEDAAAARSLLRSDGAAAERFGQHLQQTELLQQQLHQQYQQQKSEDQLQREFERFLESAN